MESLVQVAISTVQDGEMFSVSTNSRIYRMRGWNDDYRVLVSDAINGNESYWLTTPEFKVWVIRA